MHIHVACCGLFFVKVILSFSWEIDYYDNNNKKRLVSFIPLPCVCMHYMVCNTKCKENEEMRKKLLVCLSVSLVSLPCCVLPACSQKRKEKIEPASFILSPRRYFHMKKEEERRIMREEVRWWCLFAFRVDYSEMEWIAVF